MYFDLGHYAEYLEAKKELIRISAFVDPESEIAEVVDRISKTEGGGKALLFENNGTEFPLLINAWGSDSRIAYALGVNDIEEIPKEMDRLFNRIAKTGTSLRDKLKLLPILKETLDIFPKVVKVKKPVCQEVVMPVPKLSALPILKCRPHDGGHFITLPCVHTKSLETGIRNLGMYRMQVYNDYTTGMHWHRHKTGAKHFEEYKKAGKIMPVVVTLGGDPVYTWCATAPLPENTDEYILAGFLRKKPVKLVKCLTQEIEVPEDADFVIEGYIDPSEPFRIEGPFGDHTGFYSLPDLYPVFHVTCITYRKGAIYPATVTGIPPQEDVYFGKASERIFLSPVRTVVAPEIKDLYFPEQGVIHNAVIVSIEKSYPGQAAKVAEALRGAGQMMFSKLIITTDSNVDVRNINSVAEAMTKNWNPASDTFISKGPIDILDHAARHTGYGGKICIDATKKLPEEQSEPKNIDFGSLYALVHAGKYKIGTGNKSKSIVIFDDEVDLTDYETCAWLAGNNVDPAADCKIYDGQLIVDATSKINRKDFYRPWPNPVCADYRTIARIDEKWNELKIGEFIPSPSLRYKHLERGEGATASQFGQ